MRYAAVVLAAGTSSRMGRPKQVLPLGGRSMLQHVVDAAAAARLEEVAVVIGHAADEVTASVRLPAAARWVAAPDFAEGMSASLRAGLGSLGPDVAAAVVLLGDQPRVTPEAIAAVVAEHARTEALAVRASYGGRPGHPVLLDRRIWPEVRAVRGDSGAAGLLEDHPGWVVPAEVGGEAPPDVDTEADYRRLSGGNGPSRGPK